jgi:hypothetical protein
MAASRASTGTRDHQAAVDQLRRGPRARPGHDRDGPAGQPDGVRPFEPDPRSCGLGPQGGGVARDPRPPLVEHAGREVGGRARAGTTSSSRSAARSTRRPAPGPRGHPQDDVDPVPVDVDRAEGPLGGGDWRGAAARRRRRGGRTTIQRSGAPGQRPASDTSPVSLPLRSLYGVLAVVALLALATVSASEAGPAEDVAVSRPAAVTTSADHRPARIGAATAPPRGGSRR